MLDYGLKDKVALITGVNNPQGIGATTAFAFAREGAKLVLVYKKIPRAFDKNKTGKNGADRYFAANAGDTEAVENKLKEMGADFVVLEADISSEDDVEKIYAAAIERFGRVDVLVNNAADGDMDGIDTIEKITQKVIDDTFAVNVRGSIMMITGGLSISRRMRLKFLQVKLPTARARLHWKRLPAVLRLKSQNTESR